jgi:hypothetical protein
MYMYVLLFCIFLGRLECVGHSCTMSPLCDFEGCLYSNPESCHGVGSRQATNLATYPPTMYISYISQWEYTAGYNAGSWHTHTSGRPPSSRYPH